MSGGQFDYVQFKIMDVSQDLDACLENLKDSDYLEISNETVLIIKDTVFKLKEVSILLNRIDWLISGDDSEKTFKVRLADDLKKLKEENSNV